MPYDFDSVIERRGTASLKWDFEEKFAGTAGSGGGLLPLWVADMDFRVPPEILGPMRARLEHGVFGYTLEPESWFEAAAAWWARRHGWAVPREWMIAAPGVIPSLVACILALTEPGDGVVIQPPVYYPFALRVKANGRRVVENPLLLRGARWEMDLEGLERVIDARTKLLVLCNPHNPVGRAWERETLARLASLCARRGVTVVSDEIHGDLVLPGHRHVPFASASAEAASCSVVLASATKTFNLAGMGGSVTVVPDPGLRARVERQHHALFAGVANALAVAAAEAAWRRGGPWLDALLAHVADSVGFMESFLAAHLPAVRVMPLEATYLPLLDMRGLRLPDGEIRRRLLGDAKVWLDEGSMFGTGGEGFQRVNVACPRPILAQAMDRIAAAFAPSDK